MKKRNKILFVIPNSQISGAENQLLLLIKNMDLKRFELEACCLDGDGPFLDYLKNLGLTGYSIERNKSFDFLRLKKLYKIIKKNNYDTVVSFCWSAIQYSRLCCLFLPSRHIACERGHDYNKFNVINIISRILEPISDQIIFNSKIQMFKYQKKFQIKNVPIQTIHNGINIDDFQNKKRILIHRDLNLRPDTKLIGTVGNFTSVKNFNMFIEVCEKITQSYDDIHFLAIGDGQNRGKYESIVRSKNLENKLTFLGYRKNMNEIFPCLDIFLLTSNREGMPNVVMEAMVCRVPVITTNIDGSKELIDNEINGYLVEKNDVSMMVKIIEKIINNPQTKSTITKYAFEKISKNFTVEKMVEKYEDLFLQI
tara:strand:+ start:1034 stop:2134 length:1101 start_codon:yes stop_codon:yes gene_type:complete